MPSSNIQWSQVVDDITYSMTAKTVPPEPSFTIASSFSVCMLILYWNLQRLRITTLKNKCWNSVIIFRISYRHLRGNNWTQECRCLGAGDSFSLYEKLLSMWIFLLFWWGTKETKAIGNWKGPLSKVMGVCSYVVFFLLICMPYLNQLQPTTQRTLINMTIISINLIISPRDTHQQQFFGSKTSETFCNLC